MPAIHFASRRSNQLIDEVIGFDAEASSSRNLNVRPRLVFFGNLVPKFERTTWCEGHHLVGEMRVMSGLLRIAQPPQRFDHVGLWIGLARIDHVVDGLRTAELRMIWLARL